MARALRSVRNTVGIAAARLLLASASVAPLGVLRALGRQLGRVALRASRKDRLRADQHLALAFPDRDESWRTDVIRRCGLHLGETLGEVAWLWSATPAALLARTRIIGLEHLSGAISDAGGVVLVSAHCGNWEWLNLIVGAAGVPMTVAAREVFDPRLDNLAQRLRGRFGGATVLRGHGAGQKLLLALRRRRVIGLLIDQDIDAPGAFVDFFGRPAWTPTGAATLALRTGRPVVTGFAARQTDGTMLISFDPARELRADGDLDAAAARVTAWLTRRIEDQIRAYPEQWVWIHKRWRRQPGSNERVWRPDDTVS